MVFRHCTIGGKVYRGDAVDEEQKQETVTITPRSSDGSDPANSQADTLETTAVPHTLSTKKMKLAEGVSRQFRDKTLSEDIEQSMNAGADAKQARILNGFFTVLALCHTVIAAVDPETGALEYRAQSPDEAALVQAAADVGFIFRGRDHESLRLQTPFNEQLEEYELLNVLEFNSTRKRMSVIVRKVDENDSRVFLLCKGADNVGYFVT